MVLVKASVALRRVQTPRLIHTLQGELVAYSLLRTHLSTYNPDVVISPYNLCQALCCTVSYHSSRTIGRRHTDHIALFKNSTSKIQ